MQKPLNLFGTFLIQYLAGQPLFKKIAGFINSHFIPYKDIKINIYGLSMYCRSLDRLLAFLLWKYSALENFQTELISNTVKKKMIVLDIGANLGYYTLILAKLVGRQGKVYAFEPDPENFRLLSKNIKENKFNNIVAVQKAVADKSGKMNFYLSDAHKGNHALYPEPGRHKIEVEVVDIDSFCGQKIKPDFIKMDIEGAEMLALKGMKQTVQKNNKLIIVTEFFPLLMKKCGQSPKQFLDLLVNWKFKIQNINEELQKIDTIDNIVLLKKFIKSGYTNLLLIKN
jgi:FkbM family methyltransferase